MGFEDTIDEFFKFKKDDSDFYESSRDMYVGKLKFFSICMNKYFGLTEINFETLLRGINENQFVELLEYYIKNRRIKYKVTAKNYITVLKEYFSFLRDVKKIKNAVFIKTERIKSLDTMLLAKIKEFNLEETDDKKPISDSAFYKLNQYCDKVIESIDLLQIKNHDKGNDYPYDLLVSAIMTKLIMFTGIKNNKLLEIKYKDLDLDLNIIKISDYFIHLPNKLSKQIRKYKEILDELTTQEPISLFLKKNKENYMPFDQKSSSKMFKIIYKVLGTYSAEIVAKYAIIEMIRQGINVSIILEFTGFAVDTCFYCQECVNESRTNMDRTRYLDSHMRKLETYDCL